MNMVDHFLMLAVLGHLVGDYLLQSKWMALTKSKAGREGIIACSVHVAVYTAAIGAFIWPIVSPWLIIAIAVPHWIIDRWSLASHWLRLIRGRTFEGVQGEWDVAFTALVYAVTDNTIHVLCIYVVLYMAL